MSSDAAAAAAVAASVPSDEDRLTKTQAYFRDHHFAELYMHLCQLLLYYRPEDPRAFLAEEMRKIREDKAPSPLFTESDLETMFDLIDVTRKQSITVNQLRNACRNLSATAGSAAQQPAGSSEDNAELEAAIAAAGDDKGLVTLAKFKEVISLLFATKNVWSAE